MKHPLDLYTCTTLDVIAAGVFGCILGILIAMVAV